MISLDDNAVAGRPRKLGVDFFAAGILIPAAVLEVCAQQEFAAQYHILLHLSAAIVALVAVGLFWRVETSRKIMLVVLGLALAVDGLLLILLAVEFFLRPGWIHHPRLGPGLIVATKLRVIVDLVWFLYFKSADVRREFAKRPGPIPFERIQ